MANEHEWKKDEATGDYIHDVSIFINAPVDKCFAPWVDYENFPRLLHFVTEVRMIGPNNWHWEANIGGYHVEWDGVITELRPNEVITWQSVSGLKNSGAVRFMPEGTGTRLSFHIAYNPPLGALGDFVAENRINDEFHRELQDDLMKFKDAMESGNIEQYRRAA